MQHFIMFQIVQHSVWHTIRDAMSGEVLFPMCHADRPGAAQSPVAIHHDEVEIHPEPVPAVRGNSAQRFALVPAPGGVAAAGQRREPWRCGATRRGVRLDLRRGNEAKVDRDGERAIFPGNAQGSLVISRAVSADRFAQMPQWF